MLACRPPRSGGRADRSVDDPKIRAFVPPEIVLSFVSSRYRRKRRRIPCRSAVARPFIPFPILDELPEQSEWPAPPFAWRHFRAPTNDIVQACRIEIEAGKAVEGEMVG